MSLRNELGHWLRERSSSLVPLAVVVGVRVYPFAIAPENQNPSGAVNFSKVSHAKLTMNFDSIGTTAGEEFQADVWGVHYNWLQIKDGRALTSFA